MCKFFSRFSLSAFVGVLLVPLSVGCSAAQDAPQPEETPASYNVLCLGNSITRHEYAENVEWYSDWGMAASRPENDYCHVLESLLNGKYPGSTVTPLNIAAWERSLSDDIESFIGEYVEDKDIIVVRLGENVAAERAFAPALQKLVSWCVAHVKYVLITGTFWKSEIKEAAIVETARLYDIPYYPISQLDVPENHPKVGDEFLGIDGGTYHISKDFIITHPNDKGMREIAEIIYGGIEKLVGGKIGARDIATRRHISENMPMSTRTRVTDSQPHLGLPHPFSVPQAKGRTFMDLFYWDTYFTNLGLLSLGDIEQAKNNVDDILYLIDKYGYMPNAANTGLLNRSQPPYASMMVRDVYERTGDREWLRGAVATLEKEYDFWMTSRGTPSGLNRHFNSATRTELLEFYAYISSERFPQMGRVPRTDDEKVRIASNYLSEAEGGWDFNPRFGGVCEECNPVDLNANLYIYEKNFAWFCRELGQDGAEIWEDKAEVRRDLIQKLCFEPSDGLFYDYNYVTGKRSDIFSSAVFNLLWAGIPTAEQAASIAANLNRLECAHGIAACEGGERTAVFQWDYPNAWAVFNTLAVIGLDRYGYVSDAVRVAEKYLDSVSAIYGRTGQLWEKYNAVTGDIDVKDEYAMPGDFMGWTAGAYLVCYDYIMTSGKI